MRWKARNSVRRKTPEKSPAKKQVVTSSNFQVISPEILSLDIPKVVKESRPTDMGKLLFYLKSLTRINWLEK